MTERQIIFNLALVVRRLLILTDKRSGAARYAAKVLAEAEAEVQR